jgi:uracil-DNA glycosylase
MKSTPKHQRGASLALYNPIMGKAADLEKLKADITARGDLPLMESNLVFGEGNIDCAVMFVGEAPGAKENESERPFVGPCGDLLDCMIDKIGLKRGDVYITNIVKRRPPGNRPPRAAEIRAYSEYLMRQIEIIDPKVIVTLGRFALSYFEPKAKLKCDHGRILPRADRWKVFPVYHPGAALRSTQKKDLFRDDLMKLPKVVSGEPAAETASSLPSSDASRITS